MVYQVRENSGSTIPADLNFSVPLCRGREAEISQLKEAYQRVQRPSHHEGEPRMEFVIIKENLARENQHFWIRCEKTARMMHSLSMASLIRLVPHHRLLLWMLSQSCVTL